MDKSNNRTLRAFRGRLILALGIGIMSPIQIWAADSNGLNPLFQGIDSIQRLQSAYMSVYKSLPNQSPHNSLTATQRLESNGIETTKFQHFYRGLEVIGSMALHHRGPSESLLSNFIARFDLETKPTLTPEAAVALSKSIVGDSELQVAPELKILRDSSGRATLVG